VDIQHAQQILQTNRVILCHFDSYSTALLFARWSDGSLLAPGPLPAAAALIEDPQPLPTDQRPEIITEAAITALGIGQTALKYLTDYVARVHSEAGTIPIHLLRFTTLDAPAERIAPHGGVFRHMSALRSADKLELALIRIAFDLMMSGGGK
jgi:hypothetical protein